MFGSREKTQGASKSNSKSAKGTKALASGGSNALNSLVAGTEVEGKVYAEHDIRVDGVIRGSLDCKAKVIIGPSGYIEGQINCTNAIIEGHFEGTLDVKELLNVRNTAKINGEITTSKLIVEAGAIFNVTCRMGKQETATRTISNIKDKKITKLAKEAS